MNFSFFKKPATTPIPEFPGSSASQQFVAGITTVQDILAPDAIEVDFSYLKIGNKFVRVLFVAGYPRFVTANWLSPLINFDHSLDISMFIYPIEGKGVLDDLRRKITEMEAEINSDIQRGKLANIDTQVKLEDAKTLQEQLAKGSERFYQFGLYITITSDTAEELDQLTKQIQSTLGALLIIAKPASLQMEAAFKTCEPLGQDLLHITRNMDTTSLATTFPFTSSELTANEGILYGINEHNDSLVIFDRFAMENANSVIFAKSGAGKCLSYDEKVLIKQNGKIRLATIGKVIDQLISSQHARQFNSETEGVVFPNIEVFTFNKNLKTKWSQVNIAARKEYHKRQLIYHISTKSGRQITVTPDHQMIVLRNGIVRSIRAEAIQLTDVTPLPRAIPQLDQKEIILNIPNLLRHNSRIYVQGLQTLIKKNVDYLNKNLPHNPLNRYLHMYAKKRAIPLSLATSILNTLKMDWDAISLPLKLGSINSVSSHWLPTKLKISPQLAWVVGLYLAEGCVSSSTVVLSIVDPVLRRKTQRILSKYQLPFFSTDKDVRIGSRIFAELIKHWVIGVNAKTKLIPQFAYNLNNKALSQFLQGYFDGDGCVEKHAITAVSKSNDLISGLTYLLLRFGITSRISKKFKRASNSHHKGDFYWQISVSGQNQIIRFAKSVNFTYPKRKQKLNSLIQQFKNTIANTNVDTIPHLSSMFSQLYQELFDTHHTATHPNFIAIKNGVYNPSPSELLKNIHLCQKRILQISNQRDHIHKLINLPPLSTIIKKGKQKYNNSLLWKELGQSWRLMKNLEVQPRLSTVLQVCKTIGGETITCKQLITWNQSISKNTGFSFLSHNDSQEINNLSYQKIYNASQNLIHKYRSLQLKIRHAKNILGQLKKLSQSHLIWDSINCIQKTKYQHNFVYDLQVNNENFLAGQGGMFVHNSYLVKLETIRSLMFDTEVIVIDPEDEYRRLCEVTKGQYIDFGFNSASKINPFDLPRLAEARAEAGPPDEDPLSQKLISLHSLMKIMLGDMDATQEALLDRALVAAYKAKGITPDPQSQNNEPPLLEDLYKALIGMEDPNSANLAARLEKYVKGSFRGLFDQRTNVNIDNEFIVFGIKNLEDSLRPVAMFMILDFIWTRVKSELKRRLLIVDEAWYLMRYPDSTTFLYAIAKRARKYYLGLTTVTQDVEDFVSSDYGKAIITNSSIQILMKQSTAAVDKLQEVFYLSEGEKQLLLSAEVGEGLFFAGQNHVAIKVIASPDEHKLVTSKPQDIIAMRQSLSPAMPPNPATLPVFHPPAPIVSAASPQLPQAAPKIEPKVEYTSIFEIRPSPNSPQVPQKP